MVSVVKEGVRLMMKETNNPYFVSIISVTSTKQPRASVKEDAILFLSPILLFLVWYSSNTTLGSTTAPAQGGQFEKFKCQSPGDCRIASESPLGSGKVVHSKDIGKIVCTRQRFARYDGPRFLGSGVTPIDGWKDIACKGAVFS